MIRQLFAIFIFFAFYSCGGGTAGTGGERVRFLSGRVVDESSQGLPGLKMEAKSSAGFNSLSNTDLNGSFSMQIEGDRLEIKISGTKVFADLEIAPVLKAPSQVFLSAQVLDTSVTKSSITETSVKVVGKCSLAFENGLEIFQIAQTDFSDDCVIELQGLGSDLEFSILNQCESKIALKGQLKNGKSQVKFTEFRSSDCDVYQVRFSKAGNILTKVSLFLTN